MIKSVRCIGRLVCHIIQKKGVNFNFHAPEHLSQFKSTTLVFKIISYYSITIYCRTNYYFMRKLPLLQIIFRVFQSHLTIGPSRSVLHILFNGCCSSLHTSATFAPKSENRYVNCKTGGYLNIISRGRYAAKNSANFAYILPFIWYTQHILSRPTILDEEALAMTGMGAALKMANQVSIRQNQLIRDKCRMH